MRIFYSREELKAREQRYGNASILDPLYLGLVFTVAVIIFILLAFLWVQFKPAIDNADTNMSIPLNSSQIATINGIGDSYFLTGGQGTLLFLFFACVVAMFISAYAESSGFLALPISLFFLIMTIITGMILSDIAHSFLASTQLQSLVYQHFGSILYLEDNLPIILAALTIGYIVFVLVRRGQSNPGTPGGRAGISSG